MSMDFPRYAPQAESIEPTEVTKTIAPKEQVVVEPIPLSEEKKREVVGVFLEFLTELKTDPGKLFNPRYVESFNEEAGTISLNALNVFYKIETQVVVANSRQIADHLATLGGTIVGFNFILTESTSSPYNDINYHLTLTNAGNLIKEGKRAKEKQTAMDFDKLMTIVATRLKEVQGHPIGGFGSNYLRHPNGRIVLRNWPNEVSKLIYSLEANQEKFREIMERSNRRDAKFGYEDDGPQRSWIELSWAE